ncbi:hypothetical protein [Saccharothrix texasensis]|nr:hypothetical protein [Saccharothrix texasensis]
MGPLRVRLPEVRAGLLDDTHGLYCVVRLTATFCGVMVNGGV